MRLLTAAVLSLFSLLASATSLDEFFAEEVTFNPDIPTPESVLGYQVGQWHIRHDQIVQYMRVLADKSNRMKLEIIGYSHQNKPLLNLVVTHPDRLANTEQIRQQHLARLSSNVTETKDSPLVVMMGYSVHGNEASGSNASLLLAYYLAAAQGDKINKYLEEMVILLDPSMNPDGLDRFAHWVNSNKGKTEILDTNDRLHNESWPNGRTNQYWFDLNRDWLLLRHPESQARVARFHQWKPNVLTDFHEMGSHSTYFFQPGIPSRKNPWTPKRNVELTKLLANFHAATFDKQNVLYFTEESYDDFYAGKGSTYPDLNGSVGILFEQASARGFARETINGKLTFESAIKNQLSASLSTLAGASANKAALLQHQQQFYNDYKKLADEDETSGYIISERHDSERLYELLRLLDKHQIKVYPLTKDIKANNKQFDKEYSYFVPLEQPQYRLIKSVFSRQKTFEDNTFYDVSNWNLAWSFNIDFEPITSSWGLKVDSTPWQEKAPVRMAALEQAYGYAFSWDDQNAAPMLQQLLDDGLEMRVATKGFTANTKSGEKSFKSGAILIIAGLQSKDNWLDFITRARDKFMVEVSAINSGLTSIGVDLGSRNISPVKKPKVLILGGSNVSSYEAGEIWHFLDTELGLAPTIIELDWLPGINLSRYSHIIMANGRYGSIGEKTTDKLKAWVRSGGIIWGQKGAAQWLAEQEILKADFTSSKEMGKRFEKSPLSYGDQQVIDGKKRIAGAVFSVELDLTHPLTWGYHNKVLPVFKNSTLVLNKTMKPYITVANYSKYPQLGGYAAEDNVERIAQSSFMLAHSVGQGLVIGVADNVNFRGIWLGTRRLMANSLYFSSVVKASAN